MSLSAVSVEAQSREVLVDVRDMSDICPSLGEGSW